MKEIEIRITEENENILSNVLDKLDSVTRNWEIIQK